MTDSIDLQPEPRGNHEFTPTSMKVPPIGLPRLVFCTNVLISQFNLLVGAFTNLFLEAGGLLENEEEISVCGATVRCPALFQHAK